MVPENARPARVAEHMGLPRGGSVTPAPILFQMNGGAKGGPFVEGSQLRTMICTMACQPTGAPTKGAHPDARRALPRDRLGRDGGSPRPRPGTRAIARDSAA